jgi:ribonuclease BN (tRNA processing enzyme)
VGRAGGAGSFHKGEATVKLTLIPSTVSAGGAGLQFLTSVLVNDSVVLDAGCIGLYRSPQEQARVRHVLLSHTHMDHLASLPIFVENAYDGRGEGVTIYGSRAVLEACHRDVFNDRVWPDFVALSQGEHPFLKLVPLEPGETLEVDGLRITAVALDHVVPTVGYLVADGRVTVAQVTDTGPTEEVWRRCNAAADLQAVFLEATFPNALQWLADVSKHLTPATFAAEVAKLSRPVRVIVTHIKARYHDQVVAELEALNLPKVEVGRFDSPYTF